MKYKNSKYHLFKTGHEHTPTCIKGRGKREMGKRKGGRGKGERRRGKEGKKKEKEKGKKKKGEEKGRGRGKQRAQQGQTGLYLELYPLPLQRNL